KKQSSGKMKAAKQKMTLRIPDDEVPRPQLDGGTPAGGVPAVRAPAPSSPAVHAPAQGSRPPPRDDRFDPAPPIHPQRIIGTATEGRTPAPGPEQRADPAQLLRGGSWPRRRDGGNPAPQTAGKYPAFKALTGAAAVMATPNPPAVTPSAPGVKRAVAPVPPA